MAVQTLRLETTKASKHNGQNKEYRLSVEIWELENRQTFYAISKYGM